MRNNVHKIRTPDRPGRQGFQLIGSGIEGNGDPGHLQHVHIPCAVADGQDFFVLSIKFLPGPLDPFPFSVVVDMDSNIAGEFAIQGFKLVGDGLIKPEFSLDPVGQKGKARRDDSGSNLFGFQIGKEAFNPVMEGDLLKDPNDFIDPFPFPESGIQLAKSVVVDFSPQKRLLESFRITIPKP